MTITRRALAAAAAMTACALVLAACSGTTSSGKTSGNAGITTTSSVTIAWNDPFYSYNSTSITGNNAANAVVMYLINSQFHYYDHDLQIQNDTSFGTYEKVSDDPLTIRYTFNDKSTWSDGVKAGPADLLLEWAAQSGRFNTVEQKLDDEGNVTNQGELDKGVYFDAANPGVALIKNVPTIDGNSITFVYSKPYADWQPNFDVNLPAHVVAQRALGIADPQQATDALVKAIGEHDTASLSKIAKVWSTDFNYTSLPSDPALYLSDGPYVMKSFVKDQYMTLVKNDKYQGDRKVSVDQVTIRWIAEPMAAVQALQNGDVDIINPQSTTDVLDALAKSPNLKTVTGPEGTYEHLDLQFTNGGPFDPKTYGGDAAKALKVRQAFLKSIPRQQIVDQLIKPLQSDAMVRSSYTVVPGSPNYDKVVAANGMDAAQSLDIAGAKTLLEEAGVKAPVKVRIIFDPANTRRQNEYQLIAASAKQAGFDVVPYTVQKNWGTDLGNAPTYYDAALFGWLSQSTAVTESEGNYRKGAANNYYGYANADVDAKYERLESEVDPAVQTELLGGIEKDLVDDAFGTVLFQFPGVYAWNPQKVEGVSHIAISPNVFYGFWDWKQGSAATSK